MIYVGPAEHPGGYWVAGLGYLRALQSVEPVRITPFCSNGQGFVQMSAQTIPELGPVLAKNAGAEKKPWTLAHHRPDVLVKVVEALDVPALGLTVFETSRLPQRHIDEMNACDNLRGLVVPAQFMKSALRDGDFTKPIYVIPHAAVEDVGDPVKRRLDEYAFYYIGSWSYRKNPLAVVKAYCEAFPVVGHTRLVLKISGDYPKDAIPARDDIWIYDDYWTAAQMPWLHRRGDCYVSAHRGEGWGLGIFEAAQYGNWVISTGWSAPNDYLDWGHNAQAVGYDFVPVDLAQMGHLEYFRHGENEKPLCWAEPRFDDLVDAIRAVGTKRRTVVPGKSRALAACALDVVGKRLRVAFNETL